jgi:hypothetical protein
MLLVKFNCITEKLLLKNTMQEKKWSNLDLLNWKVQNFFLNIFFQYGKNGVFIFEKNWCCPHNYIEKKIS